MFLVNPYLSGGRGNKLVYTFLKRIGHKVNVVARLELEHANFQAEVKHSSYYDTWTTLKEKTKEDRNE